MKKVKFALATAVIAGLTVLATSASFASSSQANTVNDSKKITTQSNYQSLKRMSLDEVKAAVPFNPVMPTQLPNGMVLQYATVSYPPEGIDNPKLIEVILTFASPDNKNVLEVVQGVGTVNIKGVKTKKHSINQMDAEYATNDKFAVIQWTKGNIHFYAVTGLNSDISSEESLVKIAESFK